MNYHVRLTNRAARDLEEARDYISQSAPAAARRWYLGFLHALLVLEKLPARWPLAPENAEFPFELRQFLYRTKSRRTNRALFTIVGDEVRVLAIRRPGQPFITADEIDAS